MWREPWGRVPEAWSDPVERLVEGLSETLAPAEVRVLDTRLRPQWLLIDLLAGADRRLFAKLALPEEGGDEVERPRLVPIIRDGGRLRSEGEALVRLAATVPPDDPDLGAVSVVHRQESPPALVVDWIDGRALSMSLGPVLRPARNPAADELLRKSGRWLRVFHSLANGEPPAYRYPEDVLSWLEDVSAFVPGLSGSDRWRGLADELATAVEREGDLEPEVGLHHGDMAARNLMVRRDGKIVGIDAGVEWRAPRSHDLAVFLTDLHLRSPLTTSRRTDDFIEGYGYGSGTSPLSLIFLTIATLDRYLAWVARVEEDEGSRLRRRIEGVRLNHLADDLTKRLPRVAGNQR